MNAGGGPMLGYVLLGAAAGLGAAVTVLLLGGTLGLAALIHASIGASVIFLLALRFGRARGKGRGLFPQR